MGQASDGSVVWGPTQEGWTHAVDHLSRTTPWLHAPARLYAEYGVVVFAGLLLWSWWLARREGDPAKVAAALWAPIGVLVALGVNQLLAGAVAEPRPYAVLPHTLVLVPRSADYSFPSDHAVMAGAVAVGILVVHRLLGILAAALAVLMAVTRVYVGAHFPLDVTVGLAVGALVALASYLLARPLALRLVELLARTPARVLLTTASGGSR
ncbi:MAG TPA: phosphatase PAP2 family protein [Nocardioides sp.]|uniref:phosphatase PAP2 family protein n=1 Tax=Nocardioides sp. TaxID=35761 RepID=UPI002CE40A54|nr:phosphatase PAP2 family protein [Nocardioides sp.]HQR25973.1 phosphatase PAP2 family protein [Nocardioides sp.]